MAQGASERRVAKLRRPRTKLIMGFARNKRSAPAARPAAPRPAAPMPAPRPAAPMPAKQAPPPGAPAAQGPGLMGMMGSSMAGSMAGSMLGNALMGGRSEAPAAVQQPPQAPGIAGPVCTFESQQFLQCMTNTYDDLSQCQAFYDAFKQCNAQAALQQ